MNDNDNSLILIQDNYKSLIKLIDSFRKLAAKMDDDVNSKKLMESVLILESKKTNLERMINEILTRRIETTSD